eukprot:364896-Chlamydomonas_euryale.AAC.11
MLAAGAGLLAWLLAASSDGRPAALLAASIACGYMYQGPPFRCARRHGRIRALCGCGSKGFECGRKGVV